MKKRLLSAFMALALCLTLLPTPARAEETAGNVAEVTAGSKTTQYTDIEAAFTAAQLAASATVKLLENVTISKEYSYGIRLKSGDITLDLNGCTIQTTGGESGFVPLDAVFYIEDGSSLTVQDSSTGGKIVQPNGGQAIHVGGTLTVESGVAIEVTSTDESTPTSFIRDKNCAVFLTGGGTANILGGTLTGKQGIYVKNGTLNISGGTIHGNGSYALWVAQDAMTTYKSSVTLTGGSYTTGVSDGCSIWNADGTAAALLDSGHRYQDESGKESAYSDDTHGVVGDTTVAVRPANEFAYMGANGTMQTKANCSLLTEAGFTGALAGNETWFAANTSFTADRPLQVRGTVNLILCDGVTVTLNKGIALNGQYTQPATLNIYAQSGGTGTLICSGQSDSGYAGIYDNSNEDGNETALNIYGGVITATGTSNPLALSSTLCGAGIGSIGNYKYTSTMTVNISGGTVTAKSGGAGAQAIGNGTNPKGTVTVKIAPGMKCVKTDDQSTACKYGNTDGTSVTVTKCSEHVWEYDVKEDMHTKTCTLCHTVGESEAHTAEKYVSVDGSQHDVVCVCGKTIATAPHDMQCTPNADGLTHRISCKYCDLTPVDQPHTFGENGACACGIEKSAEYNGTVYASLQAAVNAAAARGGTVTLAREVSENVTVTGGTLTVDLNGNQWSASISQAPNLWGLIPLTVTGGSVTLENGTLDQGRTSSMGNYGIRIQGGSVTVKGTAVVIGSNTTGSATNISYPAIILESGDLTLETGAMLVHGLEVPEDKHLSDYLPEGTAFGLRSYDEATKTWTVDKGLLANAYTTNVYNVPNMALVVVEHTQHNFVQNEDGEYVCVCGYVCPHDKFQNGVCTICGNECAHTDVDENGLCQNCKTQMAVKSETGGTVTYSTDFKSAMNAAENGTTVTLLADIKWGVTPQSRAEITGDGKIVTLNLNGHTITGGWLDVGNGKSPTSCTLKIIGEGSHESLSGMGGIITVDMKATLDLSEWEGGTINAINISDSSNYEEKTREAAVIVGPKAGTIGELTFGNNQLPKITKTTLSGGSFNKIEVADFGPVKLGELLADGYAYQNADGSYVEYGTTLKGASISNVKVVKCLHPDMKPDETGVAKCEYCGKSGNFVASVNGNLYTDMNGAISYWLENGGTLKLYGNYTAADGTWSIGSGLHTVDLNGHRMSVQGGGAFKPTNNMHLTVTDGTEIGQIENILLDGNQRGSFTLESGYVGEVRMIGGAVAALKGGSVDELEVQNCSANTNLSIQGGSLGKLNITDWAEGMHVSATSGSLGAYNLPSGKILADVLDHQYYAEGTSLDRQVDTAQKPEKFVIKQAPYDFGSTSKAADVPINGSIPFRVDSPSGDATGYYDVRWYRRTNSGAEHMMENKVADVNVGDRLDVFCVITGADHPGGAMKWQVAVKGYKLTVTPADLSQGAVVFTQVGESMTGLNLMGNIRDGKGTFVFTPWGGDVNNASALTYCFEVSHDGQKLIEGKDYTIESGNTAQYAGDHTLTIQGKGSYTGTATHTWRIEPYKLTRENYNPPDITKVYDGTTGFDFSKAGNWGIFKENVDHRPNDEKTGKNPVLGSDTKPISIYLKPEDFKASAVTLDSPDAGDRTASFTIELKTRDGQREPNFVFEDGGSPTIQVTKAKASITKAAAPTGLANGALTVYNGTAKTYEIDIASLLPSPGAGCRYGEIYDSQTIGFKTYKTEITEIKLDSSYYDKTADKAKIEKGKLILPIRNVNTTTTGKIGTIKLNVISQNYHQIQDWTIDVSAANQPVSSSGGGGGKSDRPGTGKSETTTKPDGTTVKTETKADGTKIQTTTGKDGSVTKTETKKDGSSVTENKAADGSTGTVKTDKNGQTTAETALSSKAIEDTKKSGEPVKAPVEVKATRDSSTAPVVKVELPRNSGETKVEIPVSNATPGTVAVIVHPDGTEEIVKNSLPTEDGIQLTVNGGATVKIVDNSKDFADTRNHWAKDAIDFVSARGLVNGMNDSIYAPDASTTRAQLWTILARQNDADLNGGNTWYEKAQLWSKNKGISDGTEPNAAINRAQMVTMLWRAMGQPAAASGASFADVPADSYYAQAVAWAIESGITTGVGGGKFDPTATCTRAQIATFLWRAMAE